MAHGIPLQQGHEHYQLTLPRTWAWGRPCHCRLFRHPAAPVALVSISASASSARRTASSIKRPRTKRREALAPSSLGSLSELKYRGSGPGRSAGEYRFLPHGFAAIPQCRSQTVHRRICHEGARTAVGIACQFSLRRLSQAGKPGAENESADTKKPFV